MRWRRRKQREQDLERELRTDLELEAAELQENGMSPEEARQAAQKALGNTTLTKENVREMWGWSWIERSKQDLTYAIRGFARTPGFTAVVVFTLALGIGSTTAIFSIVNSIFLNPLPYPDADRLVVIWEKLTRDPKAPPIFDSYRDFEFWKSKSQSFEQLAPATWATGQQILNGAGPAREVLAMPVGIDFFSLLGIKPELGRVFEQDDLNRGCRVVLQHRFWITAFTGRKDAVGRQISLGQKSCTIIGVMLKEFTFYPDGAPMWMLITPGSEISRDPENASVGVYGRLKRGISLSRAQREIEILYKNEHRKDKDGIWRSPVVQPLAEQFAFLTGPNLRLSVVILFGAVSFVLLIACVNIANLLLGRSLVRQRELAVRAALGSGRIRLIRQLLTEALALAFMGASLGILLAITAAHYFRIIKPIEMPPGNLVNVNRYVLGFTVVLAVATAVGFGLAPALNASRIDLINALRAGGRSTSAGLAGGRFAKALVIAEVMLSLTLLVGAGLLIESVNRLTAVPLGFRTSHLFTMSLELPEWSYSKDVRRAQFYLEVLNRVSLPPGVESASFATSLPLNSARRGGNTITVENRAKPLSSPSPHDVATLSITPNYFQTMDVPLKEGRLFDERDRPKAQAVAIVNQALVREYFPHENPIGKLIEVGEPGTGKPRLSIVGVVGDEKDRNFFHEMAWQEIPTLFRPLAREAPSSGTILLRAARDNAGLGRELQKEVSDLDSSVPVGDLQTMDEHLSRLLAYPRFRALVLGTFAGLALLLACVGLYGVLSQLTAQRTREFGIRMALGAQTREILTLVLRQGMVLTVAGLAAGLVAALCLTRFLSSLLYGVNAVDPLTLGAVSFLLILAAILATYLPARRAARIDPLAALRHD